MIDDMDFYLTLDLEMGDWIQEVELNQEEPLVYIDQIPW